MKIILTLCASILMTMSVYAQFDAPQQQNLPYGTIRKLPVMVTCGSIQNLNVKLAQYKEIPMIEGSAAMEVPNAGMLEGGMRLYMNPQTKTFTYMFYLQPPMVPNPMGIEACIQSAGKNIVPAMATQ
jgi:hypothetical protein